MTALGPAACRRRRENEITHGLASQAFLFHSFSLLLWLAAVPSHFTLFTLFTLFGEAKTDFYANWRKPILAAVQRDVYVPAVCSEGASAPDYYADAGSGPSGPVKGTALRSRARYSRGICTVANPDATLKGENASFSPWARLVGSALRTPVSWTSFDGSERVIPCPREK